MTFTFNHGHMSGRFDRSPSLLGAEAEMLIASCRLVTGTEVSREAREQALRDVGRIKGYGVITGDKGGMDDCFIMYDHAMFLLVAGGTTKLSSVTYDEPGGGINYPAWGVFDVRGKRILVMVGHQGRSVEKAGKLKGAARYVRKWNADTKAFKAEWNRLADMYDVNAIMVTCDWNVNIKSSFMRALFKSRFPGMTVVPSKPFPNLGTLGSRLIDFSLVRGQIKAGSVHVFIANRASDHRPFRESVTLP